jgi:IS30 family transposase
LISNDRQPYGKSQARARFLKLLELGWSAARAAREVGVHIRTARDWRDGIRKIGNTRIHPDGTVIHYADSARYIQPVTITPDAGGPVINSRYLSCRIDSRSPTVWLPNRR